MFLSIPWILKYWEETYNAQSILTNILYFIKNILIYQDEKGFPGSWFFVALMWVLTIITVLKKLKINDVSLGVLCISCYVIVWWPNILPQFILNIRKWWIGITTNEINLTFFVAMLWCFIGYLFSANNVEIILRKKCCKYVLTAVFVAIYLYCAFKKGTTTDYAIFNLFLSPIFVLTVWSLNIRISRVAVILRNCSVLIYMLHFKLLGLPKLLNVEDKLFGYIIVLSLCIILAFSTIIISKTRFCNYFKQLY